MDGWAVEGLEKRFEASLTHYNGSTTPLTTMRYLTELVFQLVLCWRASGKMEIYRHLTQQEKQVPPGNARTFVLDLTSMSVHTASAMVEEKEKEKKKWRRQQHQQEKSGGGSTICSLRWMCQSHSIYLNLPYHSKYFIYPSIHSPTQTKAVR